LTPCMRAINLRIVIHARDLFAVVSSLSLCNRNAVCRDHLPFVNWRTCDSCFDIDTPLRTLYIFQFSIKVGKRFAELVGFNQFDSRALSSNTTCKRRFPSIRNNWDWQLKELCQFVGSKCETPREREAESFEVY